MAGSTTPRLMTSPPRLHLRSMRMCPVCQWPRAVSSYLTLKFLRPFFAKLMVMRANLGCRARRR